MNFQEIVKLVVDKGEKYISFNEDVVLSFSYKLGRIQVEVSYWYGTEEREYYFTLFDRIGNAEVMYFKDIESLAKATNFINHNHLLDKYQD